MSCIQSCQKTARPARSAAYAGRVRVTPACSSLQTRTRLRCVLSQGPTAQRSNSTTATLLLGDIGGTNARFELVDADIVTGERSASFVEIIPTSQYETIEDALAQFLSLAGDQGKTISSGALACAGPVVDNACDMTNLKWVVDGDAISKRFGMRTAILNDFVAVGYAVPPLSIPKDVYIVNEGEPHERAPVAVLGPGTGLGETQLIWDNGLDAYVAWPSEGSHGGFAPRGSLQRELLSFIEEELAEADASLAIGFPCEVEHVACGSGLARIHRFLCHKNGAAHGDLGPSDITQRGLAADGPDALCSQAIDIFLEIIGAEAGAMALRGIATGGVFLAGGIPGRIGEERLLAGRLRDAYLNETAKLAPVIAKCPFYILREEAGLKGVFNYAMAIAKGQR
eukprot:jgi/Ulvmu1/6824/UM031_0028.1